MLKSKQFWHTLANKRANLCWLGNLNQKIGNVDKTDLKGFDFELKYIDKVAQFSFENILTDFREF